MYPYLYLGKGLDFMEWKLRVSDNPLTTVSWRQMSIIILGPKQTKHVWYVERITEYSCIDQYYRQNKQNCSGIIIFTQDFKFTEFVQNEIVRRSESILHCASLVCICGDCFQPNIYHCRFIYVSIEKILTSYS